MIAATDGSFKSAPETPLMGAIDERDGSRRTILFTFGKQGCCHGRSSNRTNVHASNIPLEALPKDIMMIEGRRMHGFEAGVFHKIDLNIPPRSTEIITIQAEILKYLVEHCHAQSGIVPPTKCDRIERLFVD